MDSALYIHNSVIFHTSQIFFCHKNRSKAFVDYPFLFTIITPKNHLESSCLYLCTLVFGTCRAFGLRKNLSCLSIDVPKPTTQSCRWFLRLKIFQIRVLKSSVLEHDFFWHDQTRFFRSPNALHVPKTLSTVKGLNLKESLNVSVTLKWSKR